MYGFSGTLMDSFRKTLRALRPQPVLCRKLKLIYYPIPKVASSSIRGYLLEHGFLDDRTDASELTMDQIHHGFDYPQITVREALALQKQGFRSFAVVREPMARLESCYRDKILDYKQKNEPLRYGFARYNRLFLRNVFSTEMSYPDFVRAVSKIPDLLSDEHFRSQSRFLPATRSRLALDRLIRLENLDEEMADMCAQFDLPAWQGKRVNSTPKSPLAAGASPEIIELIVNRFRSDYVLTGYPRPATNHLLT